MQCNRDQALWRWLSPTKVNIALFFATTACLLFRAWQTARFIDVVLFVLLTLLVAWRLPRLRWRFATAAEGGCFAALALYLMFALWGNYFLFVSGEVTWELGPCLLWSAFLARTLIQAMDTAAARPLVPAGRGYWLKWVGLACVAAAPLLLYHESLNPAVMSIDSNTHISQAIDAAPLADWHSPLYTLLIRLLLHIRPQIAFVSLAQVLLVACVIATCGMLLHRQGVPYYAVCVGVGLFALAPNNGLQINTIWKDIPFCFGLLLLTHSLLRLLAELDQPEPKKNALLWPGIQCAGAMAGVFLFRQNGVAPFVGAAVALIVLFIRYRRWLLPAILAAALLVVGLVTGPLYHGVYQVEHDEMSSNGKYYALLHDVQGVYYAFGSFSPQSEALLHRIIPDIEEKREQYHPTWMTDTFYDMEEVTLASFAGLYLDTFFRNPLLTIRGILVRCNGYWSVMLRDQHYMNVTAVTENLIMEELYFPEEIAEYGMRRRESFFTEVVDRLKAFSMEPIPAGVFWSLGLWAVLLLLAVFHCAFRQKARLLLALLPVACNHIALLLTSSWTDYRYGYALFLIGVFFPVYALAYRPGLKGQPKQAVRAEGETHGQGNQPGGTDHFDALPERSGDAGDLH